MLQLLLRLNFVSLIFLMIGCGTKIACAGNFLTFFWLFHVCESFHNNHYILLCQVTIEHSWTTVLGNTKNSFISYGL